jgi:hypothetical protein
MMTNRVKLKFIVLSRNTVATIIIHSQHYRTMRIYITLYQDIASQLMSTHGENINVTVNIIYLNYFILNVILTMG